MTSPFSVVFYGVRYRVSIDEIEQLENRNDRRLTDARNDGLEVFWSRFGDDRSYFLFVGKRLSLMGVGNDLSKTYSRREIETAMDDVEDRLSKGNWEGSVRLHLQWGEDV